MLMTYTRIRRQHQFSFFSRLWAQENEHFYCIKIRLSIDWSIHIKVAMVVIPY